MEWRTRSSGWRIVQPEIGHAPCLYSVLLVSPEAPRIRVFLQDDPNEQPEAVTRGLLVVPARIGVYRSPRCPGPVVPGHPSRRVKEKIPSGNVVDKNAKHPGESSRTGTRNHGRRRNPELGRGSATVAGGLRKGLDATPSQAGGGPTGAGTTRAIRGPPRRHTRQPPLPVKRCRRRHRASPPPGRARRPDRDRPSPEFPESSHRRSGA